MVALLLDLKINITERSRRMEVGEEEKNKVHPRGRGGGMGGCRREVRMGMVWL
jgi:hypothetical protein